MRDMTECRAQGFECRAHRFLYLMREVECRVQIFWVACAVSHVFYAWLEAACVTVPFLWCRASLCVVSALEMTIVWCLTGKGPRYGPKETKGFMNYYQWVYKTGEAACWCYVTWCSLTGCRRESSQPITIHSWKCKYCSDSSEWWAGSTQLFIANC